MARLATIRERLQHPAAEYALAAAFGLFWFLTRADPRVLLPSNTDWLLKGDWASYYHGWLFFIGGDWSLPPGRTQDLIHPWGTSVFYTNSVFWLSVVGKLIQPLVKAEFQLYGWFLASSYMGMGLAALWLFRRFELPPLARLAAAAIAVMNPVVQNRFGHIALTAHWLVIAQLALAIDSVRAPAAARRNAWWNTGLGAFSVGVDGYLAAITLPIAAAGIAVAHWRGRLGVKSAMVHLLVLSGGTIAALWLVGAFSRTEVERTAEGFGEFSADLTTLFNSLGLSRWIPGIPVMPRQGEGFGYLGAGVLLLSISAAVSAVKHSHVAVDWLRRAWPIGVVCLAEAFYALSARISWSGRPLLEFWSFYELFNPLPQLFRTSGRFIWPLHWLIVLAVILLTFRLLGRRWIAPALFVAALVQGLEVAPRAYVFEARPVQPMSDAWKGIGREYRHLKLWPIQLQWICPYDEDLVARLARVAFRERMTFNSGLVGRVSAAAARLCSAHHEGPIDAQTVYVVHPAYLPDFTAGTCGVLDGVHVCVANDDTELGRRLRKAHP